MLWRPHTFGDLLKLRLISVPLSLSHTICLSLSASGRLPDFLPLHRGRGSQFLWAEEWPLSSQLPNLCCCHAKTAKSRLFQNGANRPAQTICDRGFELVAKQT